ncbi:MFS transporter [Demequina sp. SYSU T00192]|uniref:MFS transporter n=1 Tax=Demequina litoralis TaxID=3051660 RepID=A0ABT8G7S5_9MICO|nr:MFS transporter [Demequina sp. SYSU T00192]MDN4475184.1 MFS transporter [Demequina sp. SYSU T00192]
MTGRSRGGLAAALAVYLVALTLRPAQTSVGPVLGDIGADLGLGEGALGLLGALPLLGFAAVSPLVHRLSSRWGAEGTLLAALAGLVLGVVVRSWTGAPGLWLGTAVIGATVAIGNVLVPVIVKRDFPDRIALATGAYSAVIAGSAAVGAAVAVPLAAAGTWRLALGVWAVPFAVVALVWWLRTRVRHDAEATVAEVDLAHSSVWRSATAWLVTGFMGLQATSFYVLVTWLPTIEASFGVSAHTAGIHLFVYQMVGIVGGLLIPFVMRPASQVGAAVTSTLFITVGTAGLLVAPDAVVAWIVIAGLGSGASLVMALSLMSLRGRTPSETTQLSGMAQSIGYLLAAVGPVAAGVLAEATGSWTPTLILLLAFAAGQLVVGLAVGVDRRARL